MMRRGTLYGLGAAVLILVLAAGVWLWRWQSASGPAAMPNAATATGGGMAGMNMPPGGVVQLTAEQLRHFGVTFGTADRRTLESTVRTVGTVIVDETTLTQVTPKFGGYVERLYVESTGAPVRRGEPLMDVYSPELVAAEQELLVAGSLQKGIGQSAVPGVLTPPTDLVSAARRRLELWDISDAQIDEILRTGAVRRTLTLYSPASGVVMEKNVVQGQAIQPGQMLYTIANLSDVWVDVALREQDAAAVRSGSAARVQLAAYPGRSVAGRVAYVYPTLESVARTVRARIQVPNTSGLLKPGMYATVTLSTPGRSALTVPSSAVVRTGERTLVFVDMGGGRLMPQEIEAGRTDDAYTEVLSGLQPGQRVVTSAQFLLDSESNLAEVMKSMIGQTGSSEVNEMNDMPGMTMPPAAPPTAQRPRR